jgi:hypothetical protein
VLQSTGVFGVGEKLHRISILHKSMQAMTLCPVWLGFLQKSKANQKTQSYNYFRSKVAFALVKKNSFGPKYYPSNRYFPFLPSICISGADEDGVARHGLPFRRVWAIPRWRTRASSPPLVVGLLHGVRCGALLPL